MLLENIQAHVDRLDVSSYVVASSGGATEGDLAAFEARIGFGLPRDFRDFAMSSLGGLHVEVREEQWPRAKQFDIGPFWSFLRGIKVFGIASDIPDGLDLRVQHQQMKDRGEDGLAPFLQLIGNADCFCFDRTGRIVEWSHETGVRHEVAHSFFDLLMREFEELEIRRLCKVNHEDIQDYHERVNGAVFLSSQVQIFLETRPASLKTLLLIKTSLGLDSSIGDLKDASEATPCAIAKNLTYIDAIRRCEKVNAVENCLGIRLARDVGRRLPLDRRQADELVQ